MSICVRASESIPIPVPPITSQKYLTFQKVYDIRNEPPADMMLEITDSLAGRYFGLKKSNANVIGVKYLRPNLTVQSLNPGMGSIQTVVYYNVTASPNDWVGVMINAGDRRRRSSSGSWASDGSVMPPPSGYIETGWKADIGTTPLYCAFENNSIYRYYTNLAPDYELMPFTKTQDAKIVGTYKDTNVGNPFSVIDVTQENQSFIVMNPLDTTPTKTSPPSGSRLMVEFKGVFYALRNVSDGVEFWKIAIGETSFSLAFKITVASKHKWVHNQLNESLYIGMENGHQYRVLEAGGIFTVQLANIDPPFDLPSDCFPQRGVTLLANNKYDIFSITENTRIFGA